MKYIGFPMFSYQNGVKKVKKVKQARAPESSNAQPIPGQHQGPAAPAQRISTPNNAIWPQTKPYSSKYH